MKDKLTIVVRIEAAPGKTDVLKNELKKLVKPTREEPGCVQYDMHQDNSNPGVFVFYENWENRDLWQAHMNNPNLAAFVKATEGAIAAYTLNELSKV